MSIVLEALEKVQKDKNRAETQSLLRKKLDEERSTAKIKEEDKSFRTDIEKAPEKGRETKIKLVPAARHGFHKKYFVYIFILIAANLIFAGWWLNYNNSIVYDNSLTESHILVPQDIPVSENTGIVLDTAPQTDVIEGLPLLNVTGIVWDEKDPIVLVNSKFLKKGDEIKGAKVIDIQLHEVRFLYKDREFTVSVE